MSLPSRALIVTAAVALTLAACDRRERETAPEAAAPADQGQVTPADGAAPMTYESENRFAEVSLNLPDAVRAQPDLHARLYAEGVRELRTFTEGAQADRTEYEGDMDLPPYAKDITFVAAGETGKLISLQRNSYENTGGAHPNPAYGAVIWDKALKQFVQPAQLFRRGADLSSLDNALCEAINAARRERNPDAETIGLNPTRSGWSCPRAGSTPFVLAASSTPGKAGGLIFLIGPYQVGPYAEGGYEIAVPQSAFRSLLAPAYADEFAGQPPRTGDITDLG
ncbi:PdaC/SigV domain-containing protein [Brevundimonas sp.]|uniref:DUF3298 and DUF4163 domain-containing protein n=1 Tax=Brevundimonas sp. TaxID=1871086 RepID=UPI00391A17E0